MANSFGANAKVQPAQKPVMTDVKRQSYDLSSFSMQVGAMGSLTALKCIPIVAGDSISLDASCVFRLAPLRRNLYLDAQVDLAAFYIPYRHIYGDNWIDFIKAGQDEAVTLGTDSMQTDARLSAAGMAHGLNVALPRWFTRGMIQIWNRYFRDPSDVAGILADDYFTTLAANSPILDYGLPCCHLKRCWNSSILSTLTSADWRLPLDTGEVNLYQLAALKGRLETESARDFMGLRYNDILKHSFDSHVNIDADKRPEMVMRSTQFLSGYDVDGTDDATLGRYTGKAQSVANLKFPRKFFAEHGTLWVVALLRFPPLHEDESHYLMTHAEPTYQVIGGDPDIIRRTGPIDLQNGDIFVGNSGVSLGSMPYGQWYREQPHFVHPDYTEAAGHPFLNFNPSSRNVTIYIGNTLYDEVFSTLSLKHWNCQSYIECHAQRFIPDPTDSIFAGSRP